MKKIIIALISLFTIILLIIIITACYTSKYNQKIANTYKLPMQEIKIDKGYNTYHSVYNYSKIPRIYWGFDGPLYKVKERNPYNDYWVIDEKQSIILDVYAYIATSNGQLYVNDISKIPYDFHSDKISKISLYDNNKSIDISLTNDEIVLLEKLVFDEHIEPLNINGFYVNDKNLWKTYDIRFHIKEFEQLYYHQAQLVKSTDDKYYIAHGYAFVYAEIPPEICEKIDEAFLNVNAEF